MVQNKMVQNKMVQNKKWVSRILMGLSLCIVASSVFASIGPLQQKRKHVITQQERMAYSNARTACYQAITANQAVMDGWVRKEQVNKELASVQEQNIQKQVSDQVLQGKELEAQQVNSVYYSYVINRQAAMRTMASYKQNMLAMIPEYKKLWSELSASYDQDYEIFPDQSTFRNIGFTDDTLKASAQIADTCGVFQEKVSSETVDDFVGSNNQN